MGAPQRRESRAVVLPDVLPVVLPVVLAVVLPVVLGLVLLGGCRDAAPPAAQASASPTPSATSALGGQLPVRRDPPPRPMDRLERAVATRLGRQVARQGLDLDYLDCPHWTGAMPARMTCHGYLDGLVADVRVVLTAGAPGRAIGFDARLADGLIVTSSLEQTLRDQGWQGVDCGHAAAYPARVGSTIVCRGVRAGRTHDVVAEVRSRSGEVLLTEDRR